jgi:hypothetical protein
LTTQDEADAMTARALAVANEVGRLLQSRIPGKRPRSPAETEEGWMNIAAAAALLEAWMEGCNDQHLIGVLKGHFRSRARLTIK